MDAIEMLRRMARNNAWANLRLHRAVAQLDEAAFRAAGRTSFFPSFRATLGHLLFVDLFYVDALEAGGVGAGVWEDLARFEKLGTFAELRDRQRGVDRRLIAFTEALRVPADLEVVVHIERRDRVQRETRGDTLLHLFEHQIHHRGQAHAMLSGTPVAPPQLDEFFLREELPLREAELRELGLPLE
jgi:uncharacterized damage-inducible protein DinB